MSVHDCSIPPLTRLKTEHVKKGFSAPVRVFMVVEPPGGLNKDTPGRRSADL